ncbi:MAG: hypothetical protein ACFE96_18060, partial [Candidatus Hermodarchaeota archaeon]
ATSKAKIGGIIILISVPIAFIIGIIFTFTELRYYFYYHLMFLIQFLLFPFPIPHSAHVIVGGIFCLKAHDLINSVSKFKSMEPRKQLQPP